MNSPARRRGFLTAIELRSPGMRFDLAVIIAVICGIEAYAAAGDKMPAKAVESLGGRLLDDLSPDMAQPAAPGQPATPNASATKEIEDSLKASTPLRGFGAGASPASQSLTCVQNRMQQAQSILT